MLLYNKDLLCNRNFECPGNFLLYPLNPSLSENLNLDVFSSLTSRVLELSMLSIRKEGI